MSRGSLVAVVDTWLVALVALAATWSAKAVRAWRNRPAHRATQAKGRAGVFSGYRLRVASVLRDYGLDDRAQAPGDSRQAHDAREAEA